MKLSLDPPPWEGREAILATWEEADGVVRAFALAGRSDIIKAEVIGGELAVYPDRSAQHRALLAALGLDQGS